MTATACAHLSELDARDGIMHCPICDPVPTCTHPTVFDVHDGTVCPVCDAEKEDIVVLWDESGRPYPLGFSKGGGQ